MILLIGESPHFFPLKDSDLAKPVSFRVDLFNLIPESCTNYLLRLEAPCL
jgi:hypothetical protein